MNIDEDTNVNERYEIYWNQFALFPMKWANWLINRPLFFYLLLIVTYFTFHYPLLKPSTKFVLWDSDSWNPWIGETIIAWLETHLIFLGALLVIWAYHRWYTSIRSTFEWLQQKPLRLHSKSDDFDKVYLNYLEAYQRELASKKISMLITFALLGIILLISIIFAGDLSNYVHYWGSVIKGPSYALLISFYLVWFYLGGIMAHPLYVTMRAIKNLSNNFQIDIQPRHPDKCGGLQPLGNFCFSMSLPVFSLGLTLTIIGVGGLVLITGGAADTLYAYFGLGYFDPTFVFSALFVLILFVTPLLAASFFIPLLDIHRNMVASKRKTQDDFAVNVTTLEKLIRSQSDENGDLEIAKTAKEKLEIMQTTNPNVTGYPVWPFRFSVVIQLFSPQILSVAGFALSVFEAFRK